MEIIVRPDGNSTEDHKERASLGRILFVTFVLLPIKVLFSCEDFHENSFASLINRPRARRRPRARARTVPLRLANSRAPDIGKDQSARPVS